jgi:glyoxylase-like metal-dependent hydrolase (beta-lactamase superfamily II)
MEIRPDIHLLKVPIPDNPLEFLNAYLIKTSEGSLLIDTGWNTDEAFESLTNQLESIGVAWHDVRYIVITHVHPDHFGLVGRLIKHTKAKIVMHELENAMVHQRFLELDELVEEMGYWLRLNGVPETTRPILQRSSLSQLGYVAVAKPDIIVQGGEHIQLADFDFEIIWTPGHAMGHICLYEPNRRILFSGDHVLAEITPNVSMHVQSISNPLADYLSTLSSVSKLPVEIVLPAHGEVLSNLKERVAEIKQHHKDRNQEIIKALSHGAKNAYEVSSMLTWSTGGTAWADLPDHTKRAAVTETISHLELLFAQGIIEKSSQKGIVIYSTALEES